MAIDVTSFEQIAPILSQLATNYSNIFFDYFNLFYNPMAMDITIEYYDSDGNLSTITIPNRAKDRSYILNGEGDPEGFVSAARGSVYQDLTNGDLYIKQYSTTDKTGWVKFLTIESLGNFLIQGSGSPERKETQPKGVLFVDKTNATLYIKTTNTGNTGWVLISANTQNLANRDLSNLQAAGEAHFANPSLNNLNTTGQAILDGKELKSNKVTTISSSSTNTQYPSALAAKNYADGLVSSLANKNLNNLTSTGEDHFVRVGVQTRDCILKAPNGIPSQSGNIITLSQGTVLLCANGVDSNKSFISSTATINSALNVSISWTTSDQGVVFYNKTNGNLIYYSLSAFTKSPSQPTGLTNMIWYNTDTNVYKITSNSGSTWSTKELAQIGEFSTNSSGIITSFTPRHPLCVSTMDDINLLNIELKSKVDIDQVAADLEGKADIDLSNTNDSAQVLMSKMGMPSETYIELTLGASGAEYVAPANGWVQITQAFTTVCYVLIATVYTSKDGICMLSSYNGAGTLNAYIPVSKGETFKVEYSGTLNSDVVNRFEFIYAKGSESEAS